MKQVAIIFLAFSAFIISSCSENKKEREDAKVVVTKDSVKSDFLKQAERDPKNYVNDCKKLYAEAIRMDSILLRDETANQKNAENAIKAFTDFSYYCKNDTLAPVFLIKTAMVARSIENIPQAKQVLEHCIDNYAYFKDLPEAIFLLAQLYDEPGYLNSEVEAQKLYKQILNDYPKSPLVPVVKGALKMIGKSDKEMIEEFNKKNK